MGEFLEKVNSDKEMLNGLNEILFNDDKKDNEIKDEDIEESVVEDSWELCENIPKNIFDKLMISIHWNHLVEPVRSNMLKLLKENNIGETNDKKYKYFKYFSFNPYP